MHVLNYRHKILKQEDSKTDYLSDIFSELLKGKFSFQSTSSGGVLLTKIEDHNYPYKHTTFILRWNDVEAVASTSFQSGDVVVGMFSELKIFTITWSTTPTNNFILKNIAGYYQLRNLSDFFFIYKNLENCLW